jgi:hypothetical protein
MGAVQLATRDTNYQLSQLLSSDPTAPPRFHKIQIQADVDGGAARFRIGNQNLSDTNYGVMIFATQAFGVEADTNSMASTEFWIRCSDDGKYISVVLHCL